jgi:ADP-ribosylglycohydrolase
VNAATSALPADYAERVYAGVLGKIIGVYLGRPVEGWRHEQIRQLLGEITYYVNDRTDVALKNHRLVVPDDDITGTFTFARAMRDYPVSDIDPVRVGATWLNYIVPDRTVLWWGGRGLSTEHTAYLLMREGMLPPHTGSAAVNGAAVAEQVGAQIFVEGWALANPGDPERAADLAAMAASVSHDGEALNAARVVAALVAHAFVEDDVDKLLDTASALIPADSLIRRVIDDVRTWHAVEADWREAFGRLEERYGYHRYPGQCHVVPNHATVIHALLHGAGDFTRSLAILVSCGWDTDSNGGNVGAITGVRGGLAGIDAGPDWRGPVADRLYLPTADSGGAITDAAGEALTIVGYGAALRGSTYHRPKAGARFHFTLPGSVQGFAAEPTGSAFVRSAVVDGTRMLAVGYPAGRAEAHALTATFLTPDTLDIPPYGMAGSPTLYSGQRLRARLVGGAGAARCRLVVRTYDGSDRPRELAGPETTLAAHDTLDLDWTVPDTGGHPIAAVGIAVAGTHEDSGTVHLDHLTWDGEPELVLTRPADGGSMWRHAWVNAVDRFEPRWPEPYRLIHDRGLGLLIQGTRDWRNYEVSADVTPRLAAAVGIAARVQGLRRYYALRLLGRNTVQLIRSCDGETVLDEQSIEWDFYRTYRLYLTVVDETVRGRVEDVEQSGVVELSATDTGSPLSGGGIGLFVYDGHTVTHSVTVRPAAGTPALPSHPALR